MTPHSLNIICLNQSERDHPALTGAVSFLLKATLLNSRLGNWYNSPNRFLKSFIFCEITLHENDYESLQAQKKRNKFRLISLPITIQHAPKIGIAMDCMKLQNTTFADKVNKKTSDSIMKPKSTNISYISFSVGSPIHALF